MMLKNTLKKSFLLFFEGLRLAGKHTLNPWKINKSLFSFWHCFCSAELRAELNLNPQKSDGASNSNSLVTAIIHRVTFLISQRTLLDSTRRVWNVVYLSQKPHMQSCPQWSLLSSCPRVSSGRPGDKRGHNGAATRRSSVLLLCESCRADGRAGWLQRRWWMIPHMQIKYRRRRRAALRPAGDIKAIFKNTRPSGKKNKTINLEHLFHISSRGRYRAVTPFC